MAQTGHLYKVTSRQPLALKTIEEPLALSAISCKARCRHRWTADPQPNLGDGSLAHFGAMSPRRPALHKHPEAKENQYTFLCSNILHSYFYSYFCTSPYPEQTGPFPSGRALP